MAQEGQPTPPVVDASGESSNLPQSQPEVPLKWSEFVWSLEKMRHRPYSRKMTERFAHQYLSCCHISFSDWFRINPLEMVLLGCQTLLDHQPASRDVSVNIV